jgi:hypothetical protein
MKIGLKGITKFDTIDQTRSLELDSYSFDLRPKSFNFTQKKNIKNILDTLKSNLDITLIFENEQGFLVKEFYHSIRTHLFDESKCLLEFAGTTPLEELEELKIPYIWHYHDKEKLVNIEKTKYLKKLILHHSDLEYLNSQGELFGYLQLLKDVANDLEFELQLDWDVSLQESIFSYFEFSMISFEITNIVETSYQQPDCTTIQTQINYYKKLIS